MSWAVEKYGWVSVHYYQNADNKEGEDYALFRAKQRRQLVEIFKLDPIEQLKAPRFKGRNRFVDFVKTNNENFSRSIQEINPDMIVVDCYVPVPSVITSSIPWIYLYSPNPLRAYCDVLKAPPYYSGYSINDPIEKFEAFRNVRKEQFAQSKHEYDEWLKSQGCEPVDDLDKEVFSPYLNVYGYPLEVDYRELGPVPEKWHQLDHCLRPIQDTPPGIDEEFLRCPEKKILFSLGSGASAFVDLMQKLINMMSNLPYKIVVTKGEFETEIKLGDNMVGGKFLNLLKIIPHVDLVLTHGGNNTFVESLYFGKPMIIMPFVVDQHDNGRRVEDLGIGRCFNPWKVTGQELVEAINSILRDSQLNEKMRKIGERVRSTSRHEDLNEKLSEMVSKSKGRL